MKLKELKIYLIKKRLISFYQYVFAKKKNKKIANNRIEKLKSYKIN